MKKFLNKILIFTILPVIAVVICVLIFGISLPNVSNSISFNAKMLFLKEKELERNVNVLAVGSSMTLNNIHSATITDTFDPSYLNTASWGQSIRDDYKLIKTFVPIYQPKTIIITSNFMDFQNEWSKIKFDLISSYLTKKYDLTGFDLRYNIKNSNDFKEFKQNNSLYNYLNYDVNGGINLDQKSLIIDSLRWRGRPVNETPLDPMQYAYLDSISSYCKSKNVALIFVQSPFRKGYSSKFTPKENSFLAEHAEKVKSIVSEDTHQYINTVDGEWPDALFADYSHLNNEGSVIFTTRFLNAIKER